MIWLVTDKLTAIEGTKTLWHDLLYYFPFIRDKTGSNFNVLAEKIENDWQNSNEKPKAIIRNGSWFRKLNIDVFTISYLQDFYQGKVQEEVLHKSNVVIANSYYTKEYFAKLSIFVHHVIPIGTDFSFWRKIDPPHLIQKQVLPKSVLFIGDSSQIKGFPLLEELIAKSGYNFTLVMKDSYVSDKDNVRVFNSINRDTLLNIINCCEVIIQTSEAETQHLASIEAGACSLPVIAYNTGALYEKSGNWGVLVTQRNYHSFKNALDYVFNNYNYFKPRDSFLALGLDKTTTINKWSEILLSKEHVF